MQDYSMLELFGQEVEAQGNTLKQSLMTLKQQPALLHELDTIARSLQIIISTAQIVELEPAITLAQTMQANVITAQKTRTGFNADQIDRLLSEANQLLELSQTTLADSPSKLSDDVPAHSAPQAEREVPFTPPFTLPLTPEVVQDPPLQNGQVQIASITPAIALSLDPAMMSLFRLEVEEQTNVLNNGLLTLENQPQATQPLEALMRAAHSIKGAARIVGLDAAVNLAHVMEDCFVAAQNQSLQLDANFIDILLSGVDLLHALSQVSDPDLPAWLTQHSDHIESLRSLIATRASSPNSLPVPTPVAAPTIEPPEPEEPRGANRVVRVGAENLNRIMGLAGEALIEANSLPKFADALLKVRSHQIELAKSLETFEQKTVGNPALTPEDQALLEIVRRQEQDCRNLLGDRMTELEDYIRRTTNLCDRLYREVITSHLRPFEEGVQGFSRMVRDLARSLNKQVKLEIVGETTAVDRDILAKLEAPLTHLLRNAIDHGIELPETRIAVGKPSEGTIRLEAAHRGGMLAITIADDGKGIDLQTLRQHVLDQQLATAEIATQLSDSELLEFLFLPGFSLSQQVTEISGRGVGLDIVKSMAQEVGGTVRAASQLGKGTSFHFQLPLTLSVIRTLLVEVSGEAYAFPLSRIDQIVTVTKSEITVVENRQYITLDQKHIGLIPLHQVLDLPMPTASPDPVWVVVLSDQASSYGLVIDRCLGERELVVRPLDPRLGKVQDISAAALMGDGSLVLILDVSDLVRSLNTLLTQGRLTKIAATQPSTVRDAKRVLVVDDSITVREMERKLLQNRGYIVDIAVDGMEGWNAVRSYPYDLVISDIDMPRMNGIELIKAIKRHSRLQSIPVIVVSYRDREDDRIQGLEAGADYYLTKSSFHDDTLIRAVVDLIGE